VSWYQKVHFAIFWIFWSKMKITQADAPTIWMDCYPIQTNWCPHFCHPHHFYAGCPSLHNPRNLSWLGTGTKYAGLHTQWLGFHYTGVVTITQAKDGKPIHIKLRYSTHWYNARVSIPPMPIMQTASSATPPLPTSPFPFSLCQSRSPSLP